MITAIDIKSNYEYDSDQLKVQYERQYKGLSTDTKPTSAAVNALFLELDTGDFYYYNGTAWAKVGE